MPCRKVETPYDLYVTVEKLSTPRPNKELWSLQNCTLERHYVCEIKNLFQIGIHHVAERYVTKVNFFCSHRTVLSLVQ